MAAEAPPCGPARLIVTPRERRAFDVEGRAPERRRSAGRRRGSPGRRPSSRSETGSLAIFPHRPQRVHRSFLLRRVLLFARSSPRLFLVESHPPSCPYRTQTLRIHIRDQTELREQATPGKPSRVERATWWRGSMPLDRQRPPTRARRGSVLRRAAARFMDRGLHYAGTCRPTRSKIPCVKARAGRRHTLLDRQSEHRESGHRCRSRTGPRSGTSAVECLALEELSQALETQRRSCRARLALA